LNLIALKKKIDLYLLLLCVLALFVLILKSLRLGYFPMWMDEGFYYLAAQKIRALGYPLYPSGHVLYKSIFYSYALAFFSLFSGFSVQALRFFSVLIHVMTPLLAYVLLKDILKKEILVAFGILFYFSSWQTEYSRVILYFGLTELLIFLGVILFFRNRFLSRGNLYFLVWIAALLTHQLAIALIFCFLALLVVTGKRFFSKKNILVFMLWLPLFAFVQLQEVFLWKVGQAYSTQGVTSLRDALSYFFKGFSFDYLGMLRRSFPFFWPLFLVGAGIFLITLYIKKTKKREISVSEKFILFLLINFGLTTLSLGFMRTHPMPRYLFPFIVQFLLLNLYFLYDFSRLLFQKVVRPSWAGPLSLIPTLLIPFLFVRDVGINNLSTIIRREYVDQIRTDIIYTSGRYFQEDHRSCAEYVKGHLRPGDKVIAMNMIFEHIYGGQVDAWLFSGGPGTWDAGEYAHGRWVDFYLGVPWLRTVEELKDMIDRNLREGGRVWVVSSTSIEKLSHINKGIRDFLRQNSFRTRWLGKDGFSRAYLFDQDITPSRFYEAEWGIYEPGELESVHNLSESSCVRIRQRYLTSFVHFDKGIEELRLFFRHSEGRSVKLRFKLYGKTLAQKVARIDGNRAIFKVETPRSDWYYLEIVPLTGPAHFDYMEHFSADKAPAESVAGSPFHPKPRLKTSSIGIK
jgi:hypothetical protein